MTIQELEAQLERLSRNEKEHVFQHLHWRQPAHHGIVVCTEDIDMEGQAQRIHTAVSASTRLAGMLIRINRPE